MENAEYLRAWRKRNPDYEPNYRARNRARINANARARRRASPPDAQAERARLRQYQFTRYGITEADYNAMALAQEGCCAACGDAKPLAIDHDHATGKVRGLLCRECNIALGLVLDDGTRLRRLLEYLGAHRA